MLLIALAYTTGFGIGDSLNNAVVDVFFKRVAYLDQRFNILHGEKYPYGTIPFGDHYRLPLRRIQKTAECVFCVFSRNGFHVHSSQGYMKQPL